MTNPVSTQWETALLNKITSNGERIALIESDVSEIKADIKLVIKNQNQNNRRLDDAEEILNTVKTTLKLIVWIRNGIITIALFSIANFIYFLAKSI